MGASRAPAISLQFGVCVCKWFREPVTCHLLADMVQGCSGSRCMLSDLFGWRAGAGECPEGGGVVFLDPRALGEETQACCRRLGGLSSAAGARTS